MQDRISVQRRDLIEALRFLDELVVGLDLVGSSTARAPREVQAEQVFQYIVDWSVFRKAAMVRRALSEYFSQDLGPDGKEELERELEDTAHWSSAAPQPGSPAEPTWWRPLAD